MVRILQKTATLGPGGIQKFLINVQSNMNIDKVQYDYFLNTLEPDFYTDQALNLESKIYGRQHNTGNPIKKLWTRYSLFYKIIKKNKYSIVHIDETLEMTALSVMVSKLAGVKVIIAHSHNDHSTDKLSFFEKKLLHPLCRIIISTLATDYFACSKMAGKWMFSKKINNSNKIVIINNGIESEKYKYNENIRNELRKQMNLEDYFVIGHVGRFFYQKNHKFILDVFSELLKEEPRSKLILIGEGELKYEMECYAQKIGIYNDIIFYGLCDKVNEILQIFDAFVFPSVYEGLGIVAIESQAASLKTFCAETIPKEVDITPYCHYISLSAGAKIWAKEILKNSKSYTRENTIPLIQKAKFDISSVAKMLEDFYIFKSKGSK